MKNQLLKFSLISISLISALSMNAKVVTLAIGHGKLVDEITIGTNEVAEIVFLFDTSDGSRVKFSKNGYAWTSQSPFLKPTYAGYLGKVVLAGPAAFELSYGPGTADKEIAFLTIQITPESFPPDKTLIIPPDSKGANIIMEQSTDLVNWSVSAPGAYTNMTNNLFFRIRADRIP